MMKKRRLQISASVLILVALVLIVTALANEQASVWGVGLLVVATAMVLSVATHTVGGQRS
jgi:ABC-type uncharacterized transport system permease subunit